MGLTIEDLRPKSFKVTIKGVELGCKPPRLSHTLTIAKIGEIFKDTKSAKKEEVKQAEADMDEVIGELIPELKDFNLDMADVLELITQMMEHVKPADNKYLDKAGVKFDANPKAKKTG